jgi:ribonuclease BN (tRNA processing enzyme)
VFITHIHGDHQLGILKFMAERDKLLKEGESNRLFVVTPSPMMPWMQAFVSDTLLHPDQTILVQSKHLNPEQCYYYQLFDPSDYRDVQASEIMDKEDARPLLGPDACQPLTKEEVDERIASFVPSDPSALEMLAEVASVGIDKIVAVEVNHCPQSYACCLIGDVFKPNGKILYSGDTTPC